VRASLIATALLVLAACTDKPKPGRDSATQATQATVQDGSGEPARARALPSEARYELANEPAEGCVRTLCIGGPGDLADPANRDLGELCWRAPGVLRRCEGDRCASVWSIEGWAEGLDALISSLELERDAAAEHAGPRCRINLAGWSTGAVVVSEDLPRALAADPRVPEGRAGIDHLVAIAPYAPDRESLNIDPSVAKAWIYRHSQTPTNDCSKDYPDGPWLSPPPVCGPQTQCWDYDYSLEPKLAYLGRRGARASQEVGHCNIVALVSKIGLDNLARGVEAYAELLPHYSDGRHGGRQHQAPAPPQ
jgi:hypothetical protein